MCNSTCIEFGKRNLSQNDVFGKRIIELGSLNVNGGLREYVEQFKPAKYIGVDIQYGRDVDIVCDAEDISRVLGYQEFDIVISTEMLEHVFNWRKIINNIKNLCKNGGIVLITTRSYGFPLHEYPTDNWRFEVTDMCHIFGDFSDLVVENDTQDIGVFVKGKKPINHAHTDLTSCKIYNINYDKRI